MAKILCVFIGALLVISVAGCRSPESRANWIVSKLENELDLDDAQMAKLHGLKNSVLEARKRWKESRNQMIDDVKTMISADKLDESRARAMLDRRRKANESEFDLLMPKLAEIHAVLKPEQRKKLVALVERYEGWVKED